jgi:polyhydroxyalkanoate synthesis regulator phasin
LGERQSDQASDSDRREAGIRRRLEAADKEIREAVKAGKITEEQGKERMAALRKRVNQSQSRGNSDRSRLSREELTKRFDKNKDGKLDDEERASLRQSLSDRFRGSTRDSDSSRRGGTDYRARLMKEYDKNGDGKLDEKEREAARKAVSSRRGQGRGGSERGERSRAGERRERGAQASGRGSNRRDGENAERSRSRDSDRRSDRATDRSPRGQDGENAERRRRGISVEEYRRGEAQIRELVEKGKVSKEDAEKRLIEMRKAIRSDRATERRPGGQSGENAERRRRGSQRGEGGENRRRGNRRGGK